MGAGPAAPEQPRAPLVAAAVLPSWGHTRDQVTLAAAAPADAARRRWVSARREDATWVRTYFAPWVGRQLRGRSAGTLSSPSGPS